MKYVGTFLRVLTVTLITGGFLVFSIGNFGFGGNSDESKYIKSLSTNPSDSNLRFEYAIELLSKKQYELAKTQLEIAYQFDKKNVYIGNALSRLLVNSEEVREEIERTLQTIANRPDYASAWLKLASLYETIGDFDNAEQARLMGENLKTI